MTTLERSLWHYSPAAILDAVIARDSLRHIALKITDRRLYQNWLEKSSNPEPFHCRQDAYYLLRNLFYSLDRALSEKRIAPAVRRSILETLIGGFFLNLDTREGKAGKIQNQFLEKYGFLPPGFLVISPTKRCNLRCVGCYAASSETHSETLDYEILSRIIREKTELWGSHFTVISGGEPLLYRSRGKDLLDLAAEHADNYFMFYTNGTLIGPEVADRMAQLGNLTPAISVEGLEAETDARRGKGIYQKILSAFRCLRQVGVPFGISVTATRHNADLVLSDPFIDRYFEEEKAIYYWLFQYMPIGRKYTLDLMVTPEQRVKMFERMQQVIQERQVFIVDFWNSGPSTAGCIAAGRDKGYFHIDWNGTVSPCVFFPYSTHNIAEVYRQGGDLNTVLMSPLFTALRKWQREYGYMTPTAQTQNLIVPCPMRDHHATAVEFIRSCGANPANQEAAQALQDEEYHAGLDQYGKKVAALTDPIWQEVYLAEEPEKKMPEVPR